MRRSWPDLHILHSSTIFITVAGNRYGDAEDAHNDAKCALVWTSIEWDAVGRRRVGVWGCWGRGDHREEGQEAEAKRERDEAWEEGEIDDVKIISVKIYRR